MSPPHSISAQHKTAYQEINTTQSWDAVLDEATLCRGTSRIKLFILVKTQASPARTRKTVRWASTREDLFSKLAHNAKPRFIPPSLAVDKLRLADGTAATLSLTHGRDCVLRTAEGASSLRRKVQNTTHPLFFWHFECCPCAYKIKHTLAQGTLFVCGYNFMKQTIVACCVVSLTVRGLPQLKRKAVLQSDSLLVLLYAFFYNEVVEWW